MTNSWWQFARGRGARCGVVALWILGASLSYSALRDLAAMLGFPEPLADLFPLVIDVAVWVGSMNALEAREHGRRLVERYAWALVALYSSATVAGNALVASTDAVDPRLVRALGDGWAHAVSGIAHAAPAVTMILFAHLAGLLMSGTSEAREDRSAAPAAVLVTSDDRETDDGFDPWPSTDDRAGGRTTGHDAGAVMAAAVYEDLAGHVLDMTATMTAAQARRAAIDLVRQHRGSGRQVTAADIQRVTGRGPRQARRLLVLAAEEVDRAVSSASRPRVVEADA